MSADEFLKSDRFVRIVEEYYPHELRDVTCRHQAYTDELRPYGRLAEMAARVVERGLVQPLVERHAGRFFCRLDRDGPFTKSAASSDDKIFRYLSSGGGPPKGPTEAFRHRLRSHLDDPEVFLTQFFRELPDVMNDLARFRIVANLLSDVQEVAAAFTEADWTDLGIEVDRNIEDRIEADRWEEGASGHRAVHLRLWGTLDGRRLPLEVQVISLLELGWDLKSHLLYELRRRGEDGTIDKRTKLKVRAVSDALYVADVLFDEVYQQVFHPRGPA